MEAPPPTGEDQLKKLQESMHSLTPSEKEHFRWGWEWQRSQVIPEYQAQIAKAIASCEAEEPFELFTAMWNALPREEQRRLGTRSKEQIEAASRFMDQYQEQAGSGEQG